MKCEESLFQNEMSSCKKSYNYKNIDNYRYTKINFQITLFEFILTIRRSSIATTLGATAVRRRCLHRPPAAMPPEAIFADGGFFVSGTSLVDRGVHSSDGGGDGARRLGQQRRVSVRRFGVLGRQGILSERRKRRI
uniref:Uncharacterized protein n=1 Tax=Romanomermis culicivorax TaxID=13658 RepID=A0A915HUT6_ROMCU